MDHNIEPKAKKPNYTLRRIKTLLAIIALTASATLLLTWRTADSQAATIMTGAVYLLTAMWLAIRFLPRDDEDTTRQH
ncbi:hypothetical protein [uncultured Bifidobacterium sp.]|mgnify:FL=1|uniref:hypothetical protein n=1 Tax=uncultured Bifidobacterium sp. TaxID=165187 RepID=UPI00261C6E82|nr:hypothetical protein [uncultured Bifidobacterium sp.]